MPTVSINKMSSSSSSSSRSCLFLILVLHERLVRVKKSVREKVSLNNYFSCETEPNFFGKSTRWGN